MVDEWVSGQVERPIEEQMWYASLHDSQGQRGHIEHTILFGFVLVSVDPNAVMPLYLALGENSVLPERIF